jgi:hypothetical protein
MRRGRSATASTATRQYSERRKSQRVSKLRLLPRIVETIRIKIVTA